MNALDKAITILKGTANLARAIGVEPNVVSNWRKRKVVPVEACPDIERATNRQVLCEELNDKVDWAYIRASAQSIADSPNGVIDSIKTIDDTQQNAGGEVDPDEKV
jgi:DNA-binding transcriptional regulator YdaS (Cro superfamily)